MSQAAQPERETQLEPNSQPYEDSKRDSSDDDDSYTVTFVFIQDGSEVRKQLAYYDAAATKLSKVRQDLQLVPEAQFIVNGAPLAQDQERRKKLERAVAELPSGEYEVRIHEPFRPSMKSPYAKKLLKRAGTIDGRGKRVAYDEYLYSRQATTFEEKVAKKIMVIGGTGTGKTTLLDSLVNFCLGTKRQDSFRYRIVDEMALISESDATSKTSAVTPYYIEQTERNPAIMILDTPGFGDTQNRDVEFTQKISDAISTLDSVHAICFVGIAGRSRLDPGQSYVIQNVVRLFGRNVAENFVTMATFADGGEVLLMAALEACPAFRHVIQSTKGNKHKCFKFNNSAVFDSANDELNKQFWEIGQGSMRKFIKECLNEIDAVPLQESRENLRARRTLQENAEILRQQAEEDRKQENNLEQYKRAIKKYSAEIDSGKNFKIPITSRRSKKVETGRNNTVCSMCDTESTVCHQNCAFGDGDKDKCCVMRGDVCTKCNHPLSYHGNQLFHYEHWDEVTYKDNADLKTMYEKGVSGKSTSQAMLDECQADITASKLKQILVQLNLKNTVDLLQKIALAANTYDTEDYFDSQIKELELLPVKDDAVHNRIQCLKKSKTLDAQMKKVLKDAAVTAKEYATPDAQMQEIQQVLDDFNRIPQGQRGQKAAGLWSRLTKFIQDKIIRN